MTQKRVMQPNTIMYIISCISIVSAGLTFKALGSVLPVIEDKYLLSPLTVASLASILPIGLLCGVLLAGTHVDKYGYKGMIMLGHLLSSVAFFILALCSQFGTAYIYLSVFLIGFGGGILNNSSNALCSDSSDDSNRGRRMSYLGLWYGLGTAALAWLIAQFHEGQSYTLLLLSVAVVMLIIPLILFSMTFPEAKCAHESVWGNIKSLLKNKYIIFICLMMFFYGGMEGLSTNRFSTYLVNIKCLTIKQASFSFGVFAFGLVICRIILSNLIGRMKDLTIGTLYSAVAIVALIFLHSSGMFMGSMKQDIYFPIWSLLLGMGTTALGPLIYSLAGKHFTINTGLVISMAMVSDLLASTFLNFSLAYVSLRYLPLMIGVCVMLVFVFFSKCERELEK